MRRGHDTTKEGYDTVGPRARASGARARVWLLRDCVAIRMDVSLQARSLATGLCCDTDATRPGEALRYGCPSLLHGWAKPATQRSVGAGWAGCALGALNQFWTQCTVSESLFGTLFMSTVHKIFLNKIKSNQMK